MAPNTSFYQAAASLLGTLLVSGMIAELRPWREDEEGTRIPRLILFGITALFFFAGEFAAAAVLLGAPPTGLNEAIVSISVIVCSAAVIALVLMRFALVGEPVDKRTLSLPQLAALAGGMAVLLGGGVWLARDDERPLYEGATGVAARASCPGYSGKGGIDARVRVQEAIVYELPDEGSREIKAYAAGCTLSFRGSCIGTTQATRHELPDSLWLIMADGSGVMPASDLGYFEDPSRKLRPCRGEAAAPSRVAIVGPPTLSSPITRFHISAQNAAFVGLAAGTPHGVGHYWWRRIGADVRPSSDEAVSWYVERPPTQPTLVLADECLAPNIPSGELTSREYGPSEGLRLSPREAIAGAKVACAIPQANEARPGSGGR
jgi:hypothetical protein